MIQLAHELPQQETTFLALQAANRSWYPHSFLKPKETNEPALSSAISTVQSFISTIKDHGIATRNILVIGFSQGACLACEYVATHPQRYGGLAALSGGLIGEEVTETSYAGDIAKTPVFLGCSDVDPHIPVERVHLTANAFELLNGRVTKQIYEGMGHTVNTDEISRITALLEQLQQDTNEEYNE